jgi:hypothetical protein
VTGWLVPFWLILTLALSGLAGARRFERRLRRAAAPP